MSVAGGDFDFEVGDVDVVDVDAWPLRALVAD